LQAPGLDLDVEISQRPPTGAKYITKYVAKHKSECVIARFNAAGTFVATGAIDPSIKILDTRKMVECQVPKGDPVDSKK